MNDNWLKRYGLTPMTFEEEWNAPEPIRRTRANKMRMVDYCDGAIRLLEQLSRYAVTIPEKDNTEHAEAVDALTHEAKKAWMQADEAVRSIWR